MKKEMSLGIQSNFNSPRSETIVFLNCQHFNLQQQVARVLIGG